MYVYCTVCTILRIHAAETSYTAKTQYRKFETNIPRKGITRPQSQFSHHDWNACSAAGKYVDRSWVYINRSQTHECGN
jgi:hypothetical protein